MDERFVCRACRRGRCDQCEADTCACPACGVDLAGERSPGLVSLCGDETVLTAGD